MRWPLCALHRPWFACLLVFVSSACCLKRSVSWAVPPFLYKLLHVILLLASAFKFSATSTTTSWGLFGLFWFSRLLHWLQVKIGDFFLKSCFVLFCFELILDVLPKKNKKKTGQIPKGCSAPDKYPNTRLEPKYASRQKFSNKEKVYYSCDDEFTASKGSRTVQCVHGQWTKLSLKCESKERA